MTPVAWQRVHYRALNARQQENYNFLKLSGVLADFGYTTLRLTDDWQGADFIAQHIDGETFLKVQLKGRLVIDTKYIGKDLHVAFRDGSAWYLYPHDVVAKAILESTTVGQTRSWMERGGYSFPSISEAVRPILEPYRIPSQAS